MDTDFFASKTIDQLAADQGVQPIVDIDVLAGALPDVDIDEFLAEIYASRSGRSVAG